MLPSLLQQLINRSAVPVLVTLKKDYNDGSSLLQGLKGVRGHTDWLSYWEGWGNWDIPAILVVVRKLLFQGKCTSRVSDRPVWHEGPLWRNWLARSAVSVGLLPEGWWFKPTQGRTIMKYFYFPFAHYTLHSYDCHLMVGKRPVSSAG
jgi:hypothetical protein